MDRSISEQGLLEAPSYSSLAGVSGASVTSVSAGTPACSIVPSTASTIIQATEQVPHPSIALMQLQPQSLGQQQQPHYALYQQQQQQQQQVAAGAGVLVGGGGGVMGSLDPLSAHRDPVMTGRGLL